MPILPGGAKVMLFADEYGKGATFAADAPNRLDVTADVGDDTSVIGRASLSCDRAAYEMHLRAVPFSTQLKLLPASAESVGTPNETGRDEDEDLPGDVIGRLLDTPW